MASPPVTQSRYIGHVDRFGNPDFSRREPRLISRANQVYEVVRPWVDVFSFSQRRVVPPIPEELPEAFIRWGGPSLFSFDDSFRKRSSSIDIKNPEDPEPDPVYQFTEESRSASEVRVENPDDPDQYVMVKRVNSITFRGPEGAKYEFKYHNE